METDLVINSTLIIPGAELSISASRSSGPGGQHVNKTSSKVTLRWNVQTSTALSDTQRTKILDRLRTRLVGDGEILIHVESERSQLRNKKIALARLSELISNALRPIKKRVPSKPSLGSKIRRIDCKKKHGAIKKLRISWSGDE